MNDDERRKKHAQRRCVGDARQLLSTRLLLIAPCVSALSSKFTGSFSNKYDMPAFAFACFFNCTALLFCLFTIITSVGFLSHTKFNRFRGFCELFSCVGTYGGKPGMTGLWLLHRLCVMSTTHSGVEPEFNHEMHERTRK